MILEQVLDEPWMFTEMPRALRVLTGAFEATMDSDEGKRGESRAGTSQASAAPGTRCGPILLVEDNLINQKVVVGLLRKRGYTVEIANHGQQALDMLSEKSFALVLMDVQMPVMDGLEATHRIRADERFAKLPIIAMTAHAMNGDRERCLEAGMDEYVSKPVDHTRLLALIEQFSS